MLNSQSPPSFPAKSEVFSKSMRLQFNTLVLIPLMDSRERNQNSQSPPSQTSKLRPLKTDHGDTNGLSRKILVDLNLLKLVIYMKLIQHQLILTDNYLEPVEVEELGPSLPQENHQTTWEDFHARSPLYTKDHGSRNQTPKKIEEQSSLPSSDHLSRENYFISINLIKQK